MARSTKLGPYLDKLGVIPDKDLALLAGVSAENVRTYRTRRGIPAGWREEGQPVPDERAQPDETVVAATPAPMKATRKPKAKKAAQGPPSRKPPSRKPAVEPTVVPEPEPVPEPVVEAEPVVPTLESVVEAEPVVPPVVEAEPAVDSVLEPTPDPEPKSETTPSIKSTRKPRKTKLGPFLDLLGTIPDREIADKAGVSAENVRAYRTRRGIPAVWRGEAGGAPRAPREATAAQTAPTKTARRRGRVSRIDAFAAQVGVLPDARIAELAGVTPANARAYRIGRGIPARWRGEGEPLPSFVEPSPKPARSPGKPRKGKLGPYLEEIGILSDNVIAGKSGTTVQNVRVFRQRHGIPARWRGEGEPLPNEEAILLLAAGPAAQPRVHVDDLPPEPDDMVDAAQEMKPAGGVALLVVPEPVPGPTGNALPFKAAMLLEGHEVVVETNQGEVRYVVLGRGIVEAAREADDGLREKGIQGKIIAIRYLGEALGRR